MRRATITSAAGVVMLTAALMPGTRAGAAQAPASARDASAGAIPRAADGHPDLSGVWWAGRDAPLRPLADAPRPAPAPAAPAPEAAAPPRQPRTTFATLY